MLIYEANVQYKIKLMENKIHKIASTNLFVQLLLLVFECILQMCGTSNPNTFLAFNAF